MKCPITITSAHLVYDRSRTTTDWACPRQRYWQYEYEGTGIVPEKDAIELFTGSVFHDAMQKIANGTKAGSVDIDSIAEEAAEKIFTYHVPNDEVAQIADAVTYAKEQAALIYGLLKGFYQHTWPKLMAKYEIVSIEEEMFFIHDQYGHSNVKDGKFVMMCKPDLVLRDRETKELVYLEYKTTSSKKEGWVAQWEDAVQVHSTLNAIEQSLGERPVYTIVQGLYKGYCLAPNTPVLTRNLEWVSVGDLKVGDELAAFQEEPEKLPDGRRRVRQWQKAVVTRTGRAYLPSYKITLSDGTSFTCSAQHKWLTSWKDKSGTGRAQWATTENLRVGHNASRIVKVLEPWSSADMTPDTGYLGGILDGEGHLVHGKNKEYNTVVCGFSQKAGIVLDKATSILDDLEVNHWEHDSKGGGVWTVNLSNRADIIRLLGICRAERLIKRLDFDKLGGMNNVCKPVEVISKEFIGDVEVVTLETSTGTLIADGYATHNSSYGKQSSPFCYAYYKQGQPPFIKAETGYEYKPGWRRVPTWELDGGTKQWVENMPEAILADQFPQTPPIFCNTDLITNYFMQRAMRELEIKMAKQMLAGANEATERMVLNGAFPQRFDKCKIPTTPPRLCPMRLLCHGNCSDPLKAGYTKREPHHELEIDEHQKRDETPKETAPEAN